MARSWRSLDDSAAVQRLRVVVGLLDPQERATRVARRRAETEARIARIRAGLLPSGIDGRPGVD